MFTIAARRMGYRVHTFSPDQDTPTGQVADREVTAPYEDLDALRAFARDVAVVTFEFENVPSEAVHALDGLVPVRPSGAALYTAQQRGREKAFLSERGFPTVPFARATTLAELQEGSCEHRHAGRDQVGGVRLRRQGAAQGHAAGRSRARVDRA